MAAFYVRLFKTPLMYLFAAMVIDIMSFQAKSFMTWKEALNFAFMGQETTMLELIQTQRKCLQFLHLASGCGMTHSNFAAKHRRADVAHSLVEYSV